MKGKSIRGKECKDASWSIHILQTNTTMKRYKTQKNISKQMNYPVNIVCQLPILSVYLPKEFLTRNMYRDLQKSVHQRSVHVVPEKAQKNSI